MKDSFDSVTLQKFVLASWHIVMKPDIIVAFTRNRIIIRTTILSSQTGHTCNVVFLDVLETVGAIN